MTGAFAKAVSLVVQVVAVAVAVRTLQADGFALFVTVASLVSWINLASLGVAPGVTIGIARAAAVMDRLGEARLFVASLVIMLGVAAFVLASAFVLERTGLLSRGLEPWLGPSSGDGTATVLLMVGLVAAQLVLAVPEAAQLGYQAQFVTNVWTALGSSAALVLLGVFGTSVSSVTAFVAISQGPQVVARTLNAVTLLGSRRYLLQPGLVPVRSLVRPVVVTGLAFAGIQLASYFTLQFGVLVLAAGSDVESIALGGVILRGLTLASAPVLLITTPTWPALAHAVQQGDLDWARRAFHRIPRIALLYAAVVAVGIVVSAEWVIHVWTGTTMVVEPILRLFLAGYFVLGVWSHVNAIFMIGLGRLRSTAVVLLIEAATVAGLQIALVPAFGVTGYVAALLIGTVLVSAWILPLRARRELQAIGVSEGG